MTKKKRATNNGRICLGVLAGAHGVSGLVRIRSFTENPADVVAYGPLSDADGDRVFELSLTGKGPKGQLLGRIAGVETREDAAALAGQELYVARDLLPEPEDGETYYHADLVGLEVTLADGHAIGRVAAVHDFGAGVMLEVTQTDSNSIMLPFTHAAVPEIDIAAGRLVAELPEGLMPGGSPNGEQGE